MTGVQTCALPISPQVLEYLRPWVDLYKVDLKSFDEQHYHHLGGRLQPIVETIRRLYALGFWLEIVTLVIPGFNDSDEELTRLAEFLAGVSPDIPWHVTAFHKDYKMTDPDNTSPETLIRAAEIGKKAGLRYITSMRAIFPARWVISRTRVAPIATSSLSNVSGISLPTTV